MVFKRISTIVTLSLFNVCKYSFFLAYIVVVDVVPILIYKVRIPLGLYSKTIQELVHTTVPFSFIKASET
jgi:hypothetical protein